MKTSLITAGGLILAGLAIYAVVYYRKSSRRRLKKVANEGYETAIDVLFPEKPTRGKLHYGPVIPV